MNSKIGGIFAKDKNTQINSMETRFSFGNFKTERASNMSKWLQEYKEFALEEQRNQEQKETGESMESISESGKKQRRDLNVDARRLQYESLHRQRKLKAEKYNQRKKASLRRQNCFVCSTSYFSSHSRVMKFLLSSLYGIVLGVTVCILYMIHSYHVELYNSF